ncbi:MAG TPA: MFS transporter [Candidatus Limnocylindria bacterium]|nr:MFS transporter [Candidatus Limnocylindria bacterium]
MDPGRRRGILAAVVLASGIVFLDSTVVNVALRAIGEDLPTSLVGVLEGQSYVVNGYLLTLSALLVLAGALADYHGRRRIFRIGLVGFGATSVLCGLAPTMEALIAARLLQGAFGALLVPSSLAIITASFDGPERARAFGIWAAASSATTILGPPLGGFLVDTVGWPVAFLMNAPLVAVALYFATKSVPESRNEDATRAFDWLGAAVVAVAVGGLTYGAIRGEQTEWTDGSAWAALALGAIATLALYPLMRYREHPLVPLRLFRSRNFSTTNLSTFLIYGALYVTAYYQALFFQSTLGYSATGAGLSGLPISVMLALFSTSIGGLAGRVGVRWFMAAGPALMALGLAWLARIPADSEAWVADPGRPATLIPPAGYLVDVLPGVMLFAVGITILVAPLTTALMTSVPVRHSGLASALNNALSRIGPLLVGAVIFVAVSAAFYGRLADEVPGLDTTAASVREALPPLNRPSADVPPEQVAAAREASAHAFHLAMLISAGLCAAGAAVNAVGIRDPRPEEAPPVTGTAAAVGD